MRITKTRLKKYFKGKFDVDLEQIFKDFKLRAEDLPFLEVFLEELIKEGWIIKTKTYSGTYEYDPGKEQDYGGLKN